MRIEISGRPIAKKNNYIRTRTGRLFLSKRYIDWEKSAIKEIGKVRTIRGKIDVCYEFFMKGKLDSDLDNIIAGVNDVIQKAGAIENDKDIVSITANKEDGYKDWKTVITITKL